MKEDICTLENKTCSPCQGGVLPFDVQQSKKFLKKLNNDWIINKFGHLYKTYKFGNFLDAMSFANEVSIISENEGHHPNLNISWGVCSIEIWTHKISGLTENDFILAAKIETIQTKLPKKKNIQR